MEKKEIMGDRRPRVLLSWYLVHIFKTGLELFQPNTFLDANKFIAALPFGPLAPMTAKPDGL